jgi:uracil-DNA glycosylase family 4
MAKRLFSQAVLKPEPFRFLVGMQAAARMLNAKMGDDEITNHLQHNSLEDCEKCKVCFNKTTINPFQAPYGDGEKKVLIILESPSAVLNQQGRFDVRSGSLKLLNQLMSLAGLNLQRDCWVHYSTACRPSGGKAPTDKQIKLCRKFVMDVIKHKQPKHILVFGNPPIKSLYQHRTDKISMTVMRNARIPDHDLGAWVMPMYDLKAMHRDSNNENFWSKFKRDCRDAVEFIQRDLPLPPPVSPGNLVTMCTSIKPIKRYLRRLKKENVVSAYDFETSHLKPFTDDARIWTMSISDGDTAIAFPIHYPSNGQFPESTDDIMWSVEQFDELMELLEDYFGPQFRKVCHNMKFESIWTRAIFDIVPKNIIWCSMTNQHLLDDRRGVTGLKHQSFIRYGLIGYEQDSKKYMKPDKNGVNLLYTQPLDSLLLYNGADSYLTMRLFRDQLVQFHQAPSDLQDCRKLFHEGLKALADVQMEGVQVNRKHYVDAKKALTKEMDDILKNLNSDPHVIQVVKEEGIKEMNYNSTRLMRIVLFEKKGITPIKLTNGGAASVDAEVMNNIKSPFTEKILRLRKLTKLRDTYLAQFEREITDDEFLHPFFDLHTVSTGRSSSSLPNFQNIPTRDKEAKAVIRGGIIPRPGHQLLEIDYGSLEVRIIACYTQDKTLVGYINDPTTDMHRDQSKELFLLTDKEVTKDIRFFAKNGWVFPQFYGSWFGSCADELWSNVVDGGLCLPNGDTVRMHLKKKGIKDFHAFRNHCEKCEEKFWDRFPQVKEWQKKQLAYYRRNGRTKTMFGYSQSDYLSNNNLINGPIQGTAFQCLLWSFIRINKIRKEEGWKTKLVGQIHDSVVLDVHPSERDHVLTTCVRIMTEELRKAHPWLIVPMEAEPEITPVDGSWDTKEEIELPEAA